LILDENFGQNSAFCVAKPCEMSKISSIIIASNEIKGDEIYEQMKRV